MYLKYIYILIMKYNIILFFLSNFYYFIFFSILRDIELFRINTLSELTAVNYPEFFYNFQLIYIFLSYKLNFRFIYILNIVKESLILSLSKLFINAN